MRNNNKSCSSSPFRQILPLKNNPSVYPVHSVSTLHNGSKVFLILQPSDTIISAACFLSFVKSDKDFLFAGVNKKFKRHDVLAATGTMIMNGTPISAPISRNCSPSKNRKRPNAFMLFSALFRKKIRQRFPDYSNSDVSKVLGVMWKATTHDVKRRFFQLAQSDQHAYEAQHDAIGAPNSCSTPLSIESTQDDIWMNSLFCLDDFDNQIQENRVNTASIASADKAEPSSIMELSSLGALLDADQTWTALNPMLDLSSSEWMSMFNSMALLYPCELHDHGDNDTGGDLQ